MPVRFRITIVFSFLVFIILTLVCYGIYYFAYQGRMNTIKTRLTNRAITTARLLSQKEIFDYRLVQQIDSLTTIALKNKVVHAFDIHNNKIYSYTEKPGDTVVITESILQKTRAKDRVYFSYEGKDVIAYHYKQNGSDLVMVAAAEDIDGKQQLHSLLNILVFIFFVGNICVLLIGYVFSRGLLLPVKKIAEDVAEISAQSLTRRIETGKSRDEWYSLSVTLNELLDRLQESFELQQRFIANASHELSTPLTSISSQLDVALQRERDAGYYRQVMESIHQDVQHMSQLVQTLLNFAQASGTAGGLEINLLRIDEILMRLPSETAKGNSSFNVSIDFQNMPEEEKDLLVFGNETLLSTALKNIVINACKYSPDHSAFVRLTPMHRQFIITIEDKGIGIPKEELQHIFQPFYRVGENRITGGFGLGLSLVDRIIRIHKGNITVESEKDKGTVFTVTLPSAGAM